MSKKFTGITSAGSAIPVYDKDAHSALEQKLDTSAFSSVSGEFATVDDVVAAVSGKADTSAIPSLDGYATQEWVGEQGYLTEVPESAVSGFATHEEVESATSGTIFYGDKPSANAIYASYNSLHNVNGINGHGLTIQPNELWLSGIIYAHSDGDHSSFKAPRISADNDFILKAQGAILSGGNSDLFFSAANTGVGTAGLSMANSNQIVQQYSPKFEARMWAGAGFSIEASGAKGYDHNGNVTWDTTRAPAPTQLIAGSDSPKPSILLSPYMPKSVSAQFSSAPLLSADGNGVYIGMSGQNLKAQMNGLTARNGIVRTEQADSSGNVTGYSYLTGHDVVAYRSSAFGSAYSGSWTLTNSVQKREIECDSATSAITAIAGSAIGGKEYSAGANIDITDEVISGKDWSSDIAGATSGLMQTSGLEYDGDKISGYMGSAFAGGGEVPEGVMVESAVGYNAVNEISGYNGSAIAQYGAEKQWLVHDDTLVHVANSAQYALGVNLSAVAQLLGVDETVLWSGTGNSGTSITLSEPLENFEKVGIFWEPFAAFGRDTSFEITPSYNENIVNPYKRYAMFQQIVNNSHNGYLNCSLTVSSNGTSFGQYLYGYTNGSPTNFWTDHADWTIYKVIGIGRKQ